MTNTALKMSDTLSYKSSETHSSSLCSTPCSTPCLTPCSTPCSTPSGSPEPGTSIPACLKRPCEEQHISTNVSREREERNRRVIERKIKNRESAERSRQRKQEYYKKLELDVYEIRMQHDKLLEAEKAHIAEKDALRFRIAQLEAQVAINNYKQEQQNDGIPLIEMPEKKMLFDDLDDLLCLGKFDFEDGLLNLSLLPDVRVDVFGTTGLFDTV